MRRISSILLLWILFTLGHHAYSQSPEDLEPITAANAEQTTLLAVLGRGIGGQALWSPDGNILAIAGSLGVWLLDGYDLAVPPRLLESPTSGIGVLAFSPNSQFLAAGLGDDSIVIWDIVRGEIAHRVQLSSWTNTLVFSPDGAMLASGHGYYMGGHYYDTTVHLWDVSTMNLLASLATPVLEIESLDFSADGSLLAAAGTDESVRIWRVQHVLDAQDESLLEDVILTGNAPVKFSDKGHRLAYAGLDHQVRVWDLDTETSVSQLPTFIGFRFDTLDFRDNQVIIQGGVPSSSGSWILSREVWDLKSLTSEKVSTTLTSSINSVTYRTQDGTMVSTHNDGVLRIWDKQLHLQDSLVSFGETIDDICFSPEGDTLIAGSDDYSVSDTGITRLYRWDVVAVLNGDFGAEWLNYTNSSGQIDYRPDGTLLAIAGGLFTPEITLLDLETQQARIIQTPDDNVVDVAFSPGGDMVASLATSGIVRLWDVSTGAERLVLRDQPQQWTIHTMQFSPDGHWLAVSYFTDRNSVVELWDVETSLGTGTGTLYTTLAAESSSIYDPPIAFSADARYLAMASYYRILIWDIDAQTQQTVIENVRQVQALAFSPDGSVLAAAIDVDQHPSIGLWDTRTGTQQRILAGHKNQITALAFNPDGTLLASGSLDGTVRLWGIPAAQ